MCARVLVLPLVPQSSLPGPGQAGQKIEASTPDAWAPSFPHPRQLGADRVNPLAQDPFCPQEVRSRKLETWGRASAVATTATHLGGGIKNSFMVLGF